MIYGVLLPIDSHRTTHVDVISARSEMSPLVSTLPIDAHHPFIHPSILLPFVSVSRACGCASSARSRVCSFGSSLSSSLVRPPAPAHTTDRSHHVCLYVRTYVSTRPTLAILLSSVYIRLLLSLLSPLPTVPLFSPPPLTPHHSFPPPSLSHRSPPFVFSNDDRHKINKKNVVGGDRAHRSGLWWGARIPAGGSSANRGSVGLSLWRAGRPGTQRRRQGA